MLGAICLLVYKYGLSLKEVLGLTIPQIEIMEKQLVKICRAEAGEKNLDDNINPDIRENYNRLYSDMVKVLREKTGRQSFTLKELQDPSGTIKKYAAADAKMKAKVKV